jgi:hypothetical protein
MVNVPDGIIGHVTGECDGNVHDRKAVAVTAGSFEKTTVKHKDDAKQVADLESDSSYWSACRNQGRRFRHTRNHRSHQVLTSKLHQLRREFIAPLDELESISCAPCQASTRQNNLSLPVDDIDYFTSEQADLFAAAVNATREAGPVARPSSSHQF